MHMPKAHNNQIERPGKGKKSYRLFTKKESFVTGLEVPRNGLGLARLLTNGFVAIKQRRYCSFASKGLVFSTIFSLQ
jgi:hypothetical protein